MSLKDERLPRYKDFEVRGKQIWNLTLPFRRTDVEAETPILWPPVVKSWLIGKDPDAGKDWGQEEKGTAEDEMVGWHHWLNGHGFGWTPGVGDGQGSLVCCGSWGHKGSDMTERLNWTELNWMLSCMFLCAYWPFVYLVGEMSVQVFYLFLNWVIQLLIELKDFFTFSRNKFLIRYMFCKYFIPFYGLSFHFLGSVFCTQKSLILQNSSLLIFSLLLMILVLYLRIHFQIWVHKDLCLCFFLRIL